MGLLERFRKGRKVEGDEIVGRNAINEAVIERPFKFTSGFGMMGSLVGKYYVWQFRRGGKCAFDLDWSVEGIEKVAGKPGYAQFQKFAADVSKTIRWAAADDGILLNQKNETELCKVYRTGNGVKVVTSEGRVLEAGI